MNKKKLKLGVIFGGMSGEHEVSLQSAINVIKAVNTEKYEIFLLGINRDGKFGVYEGPIELISSGEWEKEVKFFSKTFPESFSDMDAVFPVLHGPYGEDGTIQGMLELMRIPYVGCDVISSAIGMDKEVSKKLFGLAGIKTGPYFLCSKSEIKNNMNICLNKIETNLKYPVFVKPANMGSSVGITKVHSRMELEKALVFAARYDKKVIIEQGIDCRELEVSVLGNEKVEASCVGEILPSNEFYDYEAKYKAGDNSKLLIPAPLEKEQEETIRKAAVEAFKAIGGCGMGRVDFFMDKSSGEILINEINTIPGFTKISMYPKLWEASGIGYNGLVDRLIELAFDRSREKEEVIAHGFSES